MGLAYWQYYWSWDENICFQMFVKVSVTGFVVLQSESTWTPDKYQFFLIA